MSAQTPAGDPAPPAEPAPRTGPTPALITALATQLATMLVADLRDHDRSSPPGRRTPRPLEPTATARGRGHAAPNSAGPAAEGGADGA